MSRIRLVTQLYTTQLSMVTGMIVQLLFLLHYLTLHYFYNVFREIVVLLLEHEASPNITDSKGSTPLHLASWAGHSDIVRLLLTTGVRVVQINQRVSLDHT